MATSTGISRKQRRIPQQRAAARELSAAASISGAPRKGPSRLRLVRLARGLTLAKLSRLVDAALGTLSEVETGRSLPSPGLARRLGAVLRVPPAVLFPTIAGGNE